MKRLFFIYLTACAIILASCGGEGGTTQKATTTDDKKAQPEAKANMLDREVLEAKLKEIGFPIYPGAEFEKLQKASGYFKGYYIQYNLPEISSESKEAVEKFYSKIPELIIDIKIRHIFGDCWECQAVCKEVSECQKMPIISATIQTPKTILNVPC